MGSGCSSPLKRFGGAGKRANKSVRSDSVSQENIKLDIETHHDSLKAQDGSARNQSSQCKISSMSCAQTKTDKVKINQESEITLQSEANEDQPSTTSCYTDGKNHNEETKNSELSSSLEPRTYGTSAESGITPATAVSRVMGLNGSCIPLDRHLLVSPALSPAPSTCYSPSPAGSANTMSVDLNELSEVFKAITLGLPDARSDQLSKGFDTLQASGSTASSLNTQSILQGNSSLVKCISVILLASPDYYIEMQSLGERDPSYLDAFAEHIQSSLRAFCDDLSYNLRFLNLSQSYLSANLKVNNLLDLSTRILEQENKENGHRTIIVILHHVGHGLNLIPRKEQLGEKVAQTYDPKHLPSKIEAQHMSKIMQYLSETSNSSLEELIKHWYNQVGSLFYLSPIYLVKANILADSCQERDEAWKSWLASSSSMLSFFESFLSNHPNLVQELKVRSLIDAQIEYLMNNPSLQKRTLLIRSNVSPSTATGSNSQAPSSIKDDFIRLLTDSNKLTIKRSLTFDEFTKTTGDWILENVSKIVESISENQVAYGKQIPPFIDRGLFIELSQQREQLNSYLDKTTESFESRCTKFYTSHILPLLDNISDARSNCQNTTISSSNSVSTDLESPTPTSYNHLVFISGPKGCGKSTLLAQIIKQTAQDLLNKAQIMYRFCGISQDSSSSNRLMRSLCEQFCQTQGENTTAASYIYSAKRDVINALNKIIKTQNSLIFLDGFDKLSKKSVGNDFSYLFGLDPNPRLKIFVTLEIDSELYKTALSTYTDATYVTLDYPTIGEWAQMLTSKARSKRLNSTANLYDEIKNNVPKNESNEVKLTYNYVSDILHVCRIRQLNNEFFFPELSSKVVQPDSGYSIKSDNIHQTAITQLQYILRPSQIGALLVAIESSRSGIYEVDIINIMTLISANPKFNGSQSNQKFSSTMLNYIKLLLNPWILYILCDRGLKIKLHQDFSSRAINYITEKFNPKITEDVREVMIDYFCRKTRSVIGTGKNSIHLKGENINVTHETKTRTSFAESCWLTVQASELAHLLTLINPAKAKDLVTDKNQFFNQFFYGSMPEDFIEDSEIIKRSTIKKAQISGDEFSCLINFISQSVHPLRSDGSQIYSQIYCRAIDIIKSTRSSKGKRFNEILNIASCPPSASLLPASETSIYSFVRAKIGQSSPPSSNDITTNTTHTLSISSVKPLKGSSACLPIGSGIQSRPKIFTIKDNHRHVIAVYPDKGSLIVWDIFEERPVRTISNLDQPKDLRMIDQKRAVVLCNRELKVFDLNSGNMLIKLKGVMNQKMPFFEVFGDNYVVAIARNRMYVNMLNLNTGELETTFKVGEDRFLNSLLVSANGGICVCGDETQKPFPLLVWNLNERRLMYDLRLDRHEFITRMSAISEDGHFVVSVCKQLSDNDLIPHGSSNAACQSANLQKSSPNFIVIYDLSSGTLFKKWKPGLDSCAVAICLPANKSGKVINSIVDNSILIWDLSTGSRRHTLIGHNAPADVIRVQNNRLFSMDSSCRDQSLRIWDIDEGFCLSVFTPDAPVNCCQLSTRGDALVCGFAVDSRLSTLLLCKGETVNEVLKRNKRRKSSKTIYIFDDPPSRKSSS